MTLTYRCALDLKKESQIKMRDSKSPTGAKPKPWKQLQKSMSKGEKIPKTPSPKKLEENGNSNKKTSPKFKLSLKKSPSKDKVIDKSKELSPLIHKQKASLLYSTNDLSSMVKVKEEVDSLLTKKKGSLLSIKSGKKLGGSSTRSEVPYL